MNKSVEKVMENIGGMSDHVIEHALVGLLFVVFTAYNPRRMVANIQKYGIRPIYKKAFNTLW